MLFATPPVYQAPLPMEVHLPMVPQGPAFLAAVLRARGHKVKCFDAYEQSCRLGYFDSGEFVEVLREFRPDWVGLSVYSDGYPAALRMAELVRATLPECRIVAGGPHFTVFPEAVRRDIDFVMVGEGEIVMAALVETALGDSPFEDESYEIDVFGRPNEELYDGRCHLDFEVRAPGHGFSLRRNVLQSIPVTQQMAPNGHTQIVRVLDRLGNDTLARLPFPAYDLFLRPGASYQESEPALGLDAPMLNLNTSRGCNLGCSFCSVEGVWGKAYRWFPTQWILGLVRELRDRYGIRGVYFREDQFIMRPRAASAWNPKLEDQDEVLALARGLHDLGIRWGIENRVDAFGSPTNAENYFKRLADLGLAGVFLGIESADEKVRNVILNKHLPEEKIHEFFRWAHEAGVRTVANVMFGVRRQVGEEVIHDGPEAWVKTEDLLRRLQPTRVDRYVYVGVPVSPLYWDFVERGDYEFIDVNGYVYPTGFRDLAAKIYKDEPEMTLLPEKANVRVGPSLLPGVPGLQVGEEPLVSEAAHAFEQLCHFPGVQEVNVTPLGRLTPAPWHLYEREKARIGLAEHKPLAADEWEAVIREYRPGQKPRIVSGQGSFGRYGVATLRCPSGEAMLLSVRWRGTTIDENPLLSTLGRVAEAVGAIGRWLYVRWFEHAHVHPELHVTAAHCC